MFKEFFLGNMGTEKISANTLLKVEELTKLTGGSDDIIEKIINETLAYKMFLGNEQDCCYYNMQKDQAKIVNEKYCLPKFRDPDNEICKKHPNMKDTIKNIVISLIIFVIIMSSIFGSVSIIKLKK